ncbi:hypothetical protein GQ53DRAFT_1576 [Thozetella sp. PMI_491]|nr:hypothetical protein GQ53DRAFT_1576 [Thozetella sp. PMI_491]
MSEGGLPDSFPSTGDHSSLAKQSTAVPHNPASAQKRPAEDDDGDVAHQDVTGSPETRSLPSPPPPKRAKLDNRDSGSALSDELDEGEILDPGSESESLESAGEDAEAPQRVVWNRGITRGLRTSFAGTLKTASAPAIEKQGTLPTKPAAPSDTTHSPGSPLAETSESSITTRSGAAELKLEFKLPPSISMSIMQDNPYEDDHSYREWFVSWLLAILPLNQGDPMVFDTTRLTRAYGKWLVSQGLTSKKRKAAGISAAQLVTTDEYTKLMDTIQNGAPYDVLRQLVRPRSTTTLVNDWKLPPRIDIASLDIASNKSTEWDALFEGWCKDLFRINDGPIDIKGLRSEVLNSYRTWLKGAPKAMQKAASKRARDVAKGGKIHSLFALVRSGQDGVASNAAQSELQLLLDKAPSQVRRTSPGRAPSEKAEPISSEPGAAFRGSEASSNRHATSDLSLASSHRSNGTSQSWDELSSFEYLLKYFPGLVTPNDPFCALCTSHGHRVGNCPALICRFCQEEHPAYACPTRRRCTKCRELGHTSQGCREKLALPPDEMECAVCESKQHVEAACDELWRSFNPPQAAIKRVKQLPVFCYFCGSGGHYGADCGLSPRRTSCPRRETWCQMSLDLYQDSGSLEIALALRAPMPGAFTSTRAADERPDFGGRSIVPKTHVFFEADDDDDNEGFLHAPVQKKAKPGNIKFSGRQSGTRGSQHPQQPPLPPGPPPSFPPPVPSSYKPRANALPPSRPRGNRKRGKGGH